MTPAEILLEEIASSAVNSLSGTLKPILAKEAKRILESRVLNADEVMAEFGIRETSLGKIKTYEPNAKSRPKYQVSDIINHIKSNKIQPKFR